MDRQEKVKTKEGSAGSGAAGSPGSENGSENNSENDSDGEDKVSVRKKDVFFFSLVHIWRIFGLIFVLHLIDFVCYLIAIVRERVCGFCGDAECKYFRKYFETQFI